ncbi:hypothetical protein FBQ95_17080 [Chloroflexi bacterium CFX3]|nr:hypothetical protein [Chloroflexi bacterium CFX3]
MTNKPDRLTDSDLELWTEVLRQAQAIREEAQQRINTMLSPVMAIFEKRYGLSETRQLNQDGSIVKQDKQDEQA